VRVAVAVGELVGVRVGVRVVVGVRVGVAVGGAALTTRQAENSEVLLFGSVAVAVTNQPVVTATPSVTVRAASPLASVATVVAPRNVRPSPLPEVSQVCVEKNSMVNGVTLGVLLKLP